MNVSICKFTKELSCTLSSLKLIVYMKNYPTIELSSCSTSLKEFDANQEVFRLTFKILLECEPFSKVSHAPYLPLHYVLPPLFCNVALTRMTYRNMCLLCTW